MCECNPNYKYDIDYEIDCRSKKHICICSDKTWKYCKSIIHKCICYKKYHSMCRSMSHKKIEYNNLDYEQYNC